MRDSFNLEGKTAVVFGIGPLICSRVTLALADVNVLAPTVLYVDGGRIPTA